MHFGELSNISRVRCVVPTAAGLCPLLVVTTQKILRVPVNVSSTPAKYGLPEEIISGGM